MNQMLTARFQRVPHSGTNEIIVEGGRFGNQQPNQYGGVTGGYAIFEGIVEHCMKDLSSREISEVYRQVCVQMNQLGPEDTPLTWHEMFEEFKATMSNRGVKI